MTLKTDSPLGHLPTLLTPNLSIRWLTENDAPSLLRIFGDPAVTRYWIHGPFAGLADAQRLVQDIHDLHQERKLFEWGLEHRASGEIIGTCTLAAIDWDHHRAELGFALRRDHWGRGHMLEALPVLIDYAFGSSAEQLNLRRLMADIDPRNQASIRLVQRLGFQREGCFRAHYELSGEIQDALVFGLLREEWRSAVNRDSG